MIFLPLGFIVQWQDYQNCLELRHNEGYVDAPEEPEGAYWRGANAGNGTKDPGGMKGKTPGRTARGGGGRKKHTPPPPPPTPRPTTPRATSTRGRSWRR